jgi:hypothetical protein
MIVIRDRAQLELATCECYAVIRAEGDRCSADLARPAA